MLIASADNPQKPVVSLGSTVWSLIPPAPGKPATVAVKADADIPDLKMHAAMTLRKNIDPTLQATHTIDLKFSFTDGGRITGFQDVGFDGVVQGAGAGHPSESPASPPTAPPPVPGAPPKAKSLPASPGIAKEEKPKDARPGTILRKRRRANCRRT